LFCRPKEVISVTLKQTVLRTQTNKKKIKHTKEQNKKWKIIGKRKKSETNKDTKQGKKSKIWKVKKVLLALPAVRRKHGE